jgi:hypothetical protein
MKRDNLTLKSYFETGDCPTEAEFADLIDSFLNIQEKDAVTGITNNGDGTYTFQLLSGGTEIIDISSLSDDIPISKVIGLQAILDALPNQYFQKNQDENTTGNLSINMGSFSDGKSFSVNAPGSSAYFSMNSEGWSIIGNVSSNDGQDSHIVIKRNGILEFNDRGNIRKVWHEGNDGSGSGLDADKLDGLESTSFLRRDTDGTLNGNLTITSGTLGDSMLTIQADTDNNNEGDHPSIRLKQDGDLLDWRIGIGSNDSDGVPSQGNDLVFSLMAGSSNGIFFSDDGGSTTHKIWHAGNDGSGSGLDADTVDGLQASILVRNDGNSGTRFGGNYLQFNGDGASNNDYISFNDATNGFYFNADKLRQNTDANAGVYAGSYYLNNENTQLLEGGNDALKIQTPTGYIEVGSKNTSHCHFYTDRSNFYFNTELRVDTGKIGSYNEDLNLNRAGSSSARLRITSGTTFSDQAFNVAGDLSVNGSYIYGDGKRMLQYSDSWLRINPSNNFSSGIYCGTGVLRTDGQFEVGPSGNRFKVQTNGNAVFTGHVYGKSVNAAYSNLYRWGGIYFTWDSDSYGTNTNHSIRSTYGDTYGDDLTINSYHHLRINIDSNNNNSDARFEIGHNTTGNGNVIFKVNENGTVIATNTITASNFILSSDVRLKENIKVLEEQPIMAKWISFDMQGEKRFGVSAQDLEKKHPEFVRTDEDGYKSVAYVDLLIAKNAELEARIQKMEKLIQNLN